MELAERIFETVGRTVTVDEKHMDAVTGLSGSGPAYIYIIIEALAEAGVKVGLPRDTATQLAAQTAYGAAKMVLETGYHPALLKDAVTTPAGCTIDGILELEEGGLRVTLIKAVMRATQRAKSTSTRRGSSAPASLDAIKAAPWLAYIFLVQNLFHLALPPAIGPTWALAIEEQYYFLWAPLVRFLRSRGCSPSFWPARFAARRCCE
jgi:hypothetical protein